MSNTNKNMIDTLLLFAIAFITLLIIVPERGVILSFETVAHFLGIAMLTWSQSIDDGKDYSGISYLKRIGIYLIISVALALLIRFNYLNIYTFALMIIGGLVYKGVFKEKSFTLKRFFKLAALSTIILFGLIVVIVYLLI